MATQRSEAVARHLSELSSASDTEPSAYVSGLLKENLELRSSLERQAKSVEELAAGLGQGHMQLQQSIAVLCAKVDGDDGNDSDGSATPRSPTTRLSEVQLSTRHVALYMAFLRRTAALVEAQADAASALVRDLGGGVATIPNSAAVRSAPQAVDDRISLSTDVEFSPSWRPPPPPGGVPPPLEEDERLSTMSYSTVGRVSQLVGLERTSEYSATADRASQLSAIERSETRGSAVSVAGGVGEMPPIAEADHAAEAVAAPERNSALRGERGSAASTQDEKLAAQLEAVQQEAWKLRMALKQAEATRDAANAKLLTASRAPKATKGGGCCGGGGEDAVLDLSPVPVVLHVVPSTPRTDPASSRQAAAAPPAAAPQAPPVPTSPSIPKIKLAGAKSGDIAAATVAAANASGGGSPAAGGSPADVGAPIPIAPEDVMLRTAQRASLDSAVTVMASAAPAAAPASAAMNVAIHSATNRRSSLQPSALQQAPKLISRLSSRGSSGGSGRSGGSGGSPGLMTQLSRGLLRQMSRSSSETLLGEPEAFPATDAEAQVRQEPCHEPCTWASPSMPRWLHLRAHAARRHRPLSRPSRARRCAVAD